MSTIKLENIQTRTGSGTITIGASGETVALGSGVTASGFATTNGITEADQWRLTTDINISSSGADITSNLERNDSSYFNKLGTGMTESSGIFTFPSTGFWLIKSNFTGWYGAGSSYYILNSIKVTTDNSNYSHASTSHGAIPNAQNHYGIMVSAIFDVQNTTTHKVKFFQEGANASATLFGSTIRNYTYFEFIRLGDT